MQVDVRIGAAGQAVSFPDRQVRSIARDDDLAPIESNAGESWRPETIAVRNGIRRQTARGANN